MSGPTKPGAGQGSAPAASVIAACPLQCPNQVWFKDYEWAWDKNTNPYVSDTSVAVDKSRTLTVVAQDRSDRDKMCNIIYESADISIATVSPTSGATNNQILTITGIKKGEVKIRAKCKNTVVGEIDVRTFLLSKANIRVQTDNHAWITNERVLLVYPDGSVNQQLTDDEGKANFIDLPIDPGRNVYVVLPDVLEDWSDDAYVNPIPLPSPHFPPGSPGRDIVTDGANNLCIEKVVTETPDAGGYVTQYRGLTKDEIDQRIKIVASKLYEIKSKDVRKIKRKLRGKTGNERAESEKGLELNEINKSYKNRHVYRGKDYTKYLVETIKHDEPDRFMTICINRLTEGQKYQHHLDAYVNNTAVYIGKETPLNKYYSKSDVRPGPSPDPTDRAWHLKHGATCNGFINMFLGYWYNHNAAFTVQCKNANFIRMMESSFDRHRDPANWRYRGFSELVSHALVGSTWGDGSLIPVSPATVLATFDNIAHKVQNTRIIAGGSRTSLYWTKVLGPSPNDTVAGAAPGTTCLSLDETSSGSGEYQFVHSVIPVAPASPAVPVENALASYNIYSKGSWKKVKRKGVSVMALEMDHHGGLMRKLANNTVDILAADGGKTSRKASGFTEGPIVRKAPANLAKTEQLHLRIWPMKTLRPGGYPPADGSPPEYISEDEIAGDDVLSPAFRQSLSRFIYWRK